MKRDLVISPSPIEEGTLVAMRKASDGMGAAVYFAGIVQIGIPSFTPTLKYETRSGDLSFAHRGRHAGGDAKSQRWDGCRRLLRGHCPDRNPVFYPNPEI